MARPAEHILRPTRKKVLVASEDPWLRFRLQREMEEAGCDVTLLAKLRPAEVSQPGSYDIVLTDAALFPESSRLETLRALREASPMARFVLLVGAGESLLAEQAGQSGFAQVLERPSSADAFVALLGNILDPAREAYGADPAG